MVVQARNKLRILYAVHGYKPAYRIGGPILSVSALAEALVRKGNEVTVFTTNSDLEHDLGVTSDRPVELNGVRVRYFGRKEFLKRWLPFVPYLSRSIGYFYAPRMARELDRIVPQVDLVHTHLPFVYPTYAAARAARRFRKPLFYHQRGAFDPGRLQFRSLKKRLYIRALERPIMQQATMLLALTDAEVDSYRRLGVQTPCRVVPNGIDVTAYHMQPDPTFEGRWAIPSKGTVVLFLGRLHPLKGAEKLLKAFLGIRERFPHAILVMAGPDELGLEVKFRRILAQSGRNGGVVFAGMVAGDDKLDLLARADLFCLPSEGEGFSMAVLEALASATPVLLSPGCHFPEVETSGIGRIVPAEPEALSRALAELLAQPGRLREMGYIGRAFVAQNYSWDRVTDQLLDVYYAGIQRFCRSAEAVQPGQARLC